MQCSCSRRLRSFGSVRYSGRQRVSNAPRRVQRDPQRALRAFERRRSSTPRALGSLVIRLGDAILFGPKRLLETCVNVGCRRSATLQPVHTVRNLRVRRFRFRAGERAFTSEIRRGGLGGSFRHQRSGECGCRTRNAKHRRRSRWLCRPDWHRTRPGRSGQPVRAYGRRRCGVLPIGLRDHADGDVVDIEGGLDAGLPDVLAFPDLEHDAGRSVGTRRCPRHRRRLQPRRLAIGRKSAAWC